MEVETPDKSAFFSPPNRPRPERFSPRPFLSPNGPPPPRPRAYASTPANPRNKRWTNKSGGRMTKSMEGLEGAVTRPSAVMRPVVSSYDGGGSFRSRWHDKIQRDMEETNYMLKTATTAKSLAASLEQVADEASSSGEGDDDDLVLQATGEDSSSWIRRETTPTHHTAEKRPAPTFPVPPPMPTTPAKQQDTSLTPLTPSETLSPSNISLTGPTSPIPQPPASATKPSLSSSSRDPSPARSALQSPPSPSEPPRKRATSSRAYLRLPATLQMPSALPSPLMGFQHYTTTSDMIVNNDNTVSSSSITADQKEPIFPEQDSSGYDDEPPNPPPRPVLPRHPVTPSLRLQPPARPSASSSSAASSSSTSSSQPHQPQESQQRQPQQPDQFSSNVHNTTGRPGTPITCPPPMGNNYFNAQSQHNTEQVQPQRSPRSDTTNTHSSTYTPPPPPPTANPASGISGSFRRQHVLPPEVAQMVTLEPRTPNTNASVTTATSSSSSSGPIGTHETETGLIGEGGESASSSACPPGGPPPGYGIGARQGTSRNSNNSAPVGLGASGGNRNVTSVNSNNTVVEEEEGTNMFEWINRQLSPADGQRICKQESVGRRFILEQEGYERAALEWKEEEAWTRCHACMIEAAWIRYCYLQIPVAVRVFMEKERLAEEAKKGTTTPSSAATAKSRSRWIPTRGYYGVTAHDKVSSVTSFSKHKAAMTHTMYDALRQYKYGGDMDYEEYDDYAQDTSTPLVFTAQTRIASF
eukprot:TRINITY_DN58942_c0_g1_i1.p1 TRINITY_DN58942_c0_g1~~TRINITY_DN58942_c0_g1_i1.p1  ORF type:complete len:753 (+),score=84.70 TRINITY_DN58942_c0_g1_i1:141-2399(+)